MNRVYNQSLIKTLKQSLKINGNGFIVINRNYNNLISTTLNKTTNNSSNINFKLNNSNHRFYTTSASATSSNSTTNSTIDGKQQIGIDFKNVYGILIPIEKEIIKTSVLPEELIEIQNKILNCNHDEITVTDRISAARLLYQFIGLTNKTPHTFNKDHLDKIWSLLDIGKALIRDKSYYIEILNDQLGIAVSSRYLLPRVQNTIKNVIEKVQQLEDTGKFKKEILYQKLSALTSLAYMAAANLGMWSEMVQLRSKMDSNSIERLKELKHIDREHDYDSIYKLASNGIPFSIFGNTISSSGVNDKEFNSFRIYDLKSFGFKNLKMQIIGMEGTKLTNAINEFNSNLKNSENNTKDRNGYFISHINDSSILVLGRSIKLNILFDTDFEMIHGGILDENFSSCQLYGHYEIGGKLVESQYNLIIDFPVTDEKKSFAQLRGVHRKVETTVNNEKIIYDMDVIMNIERRLLKFESAQQDN